jgi:hypothetical protein
MTLDLQAIAAWNVRQRAAREEYRNHPTADDQATVCLKCDNDRIPARAYCSFHWADKTRARKS